MAKKIAVNIDLLGNEIKNFVVDALASAPTAPKAGQMYYNTKDQTLYYRRGNEWSELARAYKKIDINAGAYTTSVDSSGVLYLKVAAGSPVDIITDEAGNVVFDINVATQTAKGAMSIDDKKKLDGVASGAQVNVLDGMTVNGEAATIANKKIAVANGTSKGTFTVGGKTVTIGGLDTIADDAISGISVAYDAASKRLGLAYKGKAFSSIDASAFVKDGMLKDTVLITALAASQEVTFDDGTKVTVSGLTVNHMYIVFLWNTDAGSNKTDALDVTTLIDTYTAGNGLEVSNNKFSVKVDSSSEKNGTTPILSVSANGVKISGVADVAAAKAAAVQSEIIGDRATDHYLDNDFTIHGVGNDMKALNRVFTRKVTTNVTSLAISRLDEDVVAQGGAGSINDIKVYHFNGTTLDEVICDVAFSSEARDTATVSWSGITPSTTNYILITFRMLERSY